MPNTYFWARVNPLQHNGTHGFWDQHFGAFVDYISVHYKFISVRPKCSYGKWYILLEFWLSLVNNCGKRTEGFIFKCCFSEMLARSH